jgi:hypothetical protein
LQAWPFLLPYFIDDPFILKDAYGPGKQGLQVVVPRRQEWIERRLSFQNPLDETLRLKILEICQKTPVTKTLLRSLEIRTTLL